MRFTPRRQILQTRLIAEEKYRNLFNYSSTPKWIYDLETYRFLDVNEAAIRSYGYSRDEFLQMTIKDIRPAEDVPMLEAAIERVKANCSNYNAANYRHKKKNGCVIDVRVESNTFDFDGRKAQLILATDITAELAANCTIQRKNKLMNAANRFVSMLLKHNNWLTAINESFNIIGETVSVERAYYFENHTNANGDALTSQRIGWTSDGAAVIDDPELQNLPFSIFGGFQTMSAGKPFHGIINRLPDGELKQTLLSRKIVSILVIPVFVNGLFHGFIGFDDCKNERHWHDDEISFLDTLASNLATAIEKRKAEVEVRKSREQFQSVINNLPGITYRCLPDKDWTMTFLSDEIERMVGYNADDFINNRVRSFASIIYNNDLEKTYDILSRIKSKKAFELEYRLVGSDGRLIWVKENGRGIFNEEGELEYIDGVIIDITAQKQREEQVLQQNEMLKDIAWTQSHMVRAPLASMMGLLELMKNKDSMNLDSEELLSKIYIAAEDLDDIIHKIVHKTGQGC